MTKQTEARNPGQPLALSSSAVLGPVVEVRGMLANGVQIPLAVRGVYELRNGKTGVYVTMPDADRPAPDFVWAGCDKGLIPRGTPVRAPLSVRAAADGWGEIDSDGNNVGGGCSLEGWLRAVRWAEQQHGLGA